MTGPHASQAGRLEEAMKVTERIASEIAYLRGALRTLRRVSPTARSKTVTLPDRLDAAIARWGDKPALLSDPESFSYRQFGERMARYARWARAQGIGRGDVVALMMGNRADYLAAWLGIARAGGVTALVNTNLAGQPLAHSLAIVEAKIAIAEAAYLPVLAHAIAMLPQRPPLWVHGDGGTDHPRIDEALAALPGTPLGPQERVPLTIEDRCVFIYTSGTTGLPKAANINHYRVQAMAIGFGSVMNVRPDDRMYDCLPMYHSNGGVLATLGVLMNGGTVVIRPRFSAREFWSEIIRGDCTLFFYIGELCRYLLNQPPAPTDRAHKIRLICGNGLRPDIWEAFSERFGIRDIREFYAATEGNIALFNFDSRPGSVGRIPKWAERRFVVKVVRFDIETEEPVRGPDGLCIECAPGEVGEAIGQILNDPSKPANRFEGYADAAATERKILRGAFAPRDAWFRSGDLVKKDARGYFFFVDRVGDTFRWKGENVATSQVAEAISVFPGIAQATVYGVAVPGQDGRAGMAAIVLDPAEPFDEAAFRQHLHKSLPDYARPLFIRVKPALDVTGTFKQRKMDLVKEGFDPAVVSDPLFFDHPAEGCFVAIDAGLAEAIRTQQVRL
jgi:fatty-acyl-CoA synthase